MYSELADLAGNRAALTGFSHFVQVRSGICDFVRPLGAALACLVFSPAADATCTSTCPALAEIVDKAFPGMNKLALAEGPGSLLLELSAGRWGESQSLSRLLEISCADGSEQFLSLPGVLEISDPFFDPDNGQLYFVSRDDSGVRNIWKAAHADGEWGVPERLPAPVNSAADEYSPVFRSGRLYFVSGRDGGSGDIYQFDPERRDQVLSKLPETVNSITGEWNLWVSEDEQIMLFEASERSTNVSRSGDLYMSSRSATKEWTQAQPLHTINSAGSELNARVIGEQLVYTTAAHGGLAQLQATEFWQAVDQASESFITLAVANRSSHDLMLINLTDGGRWAHIGTGSGPHLLSGSPGGEKLAAVSHGVFPKPHTEPVEHNPGWQQTAGGKLTVYADRGHAVHEFETGCNRAHGSAWSSSTLIWISCEDQGGLVSLDLARDPPGRIFYATGHKDAHVLAYDAPRRQVLAVHTGGGGIWFQPVDGSAGEFLKLYTGSEAIQVLPDGKHAAVSIGPAGKAAIVNLDRRTLLRTIDLDCDFPIDFTLGTDHTLWVACLFSKELLAVNWQQGSVSKRYSLPHGPINIVAHPRLQRIYASLPRRNQVIEFSLDSGRVVRTFDVGIEPDGLWLMD